MAREPARQARSQAATTNRNKTPAAVDPAQIFGFTPTLDSPMIPVMSASRGFAPTRPCVAWTSSETKTVRPKPFGARARKGRQGTAIPTANPPAKGSARRGR